MSSRKPSPRRLIASVLAAGAAGAAMSAVVYAAGRAGDVTYVIHNTAAGPETIRPGDVVSFALMSTVAGLVVALVLTRVRRPPFETLEKVAAVVAVASTTMDLPIESAAPAKLLLASMHLIMGAAFVTGLRVARRSQPGAEVQEITTTAEPLAA